jgi:hypothetical protein
MLIRQKMSAWGQALKIVITVNERLGQVLMQQKLSAWGQTLKNSDHCK